MTSARDELLFLIGYRGAGKTAVAPLVAARLGWQSCDADRFLEIRTGRSIWQIFDEGGETSFRDIESRLLDELCGLRRHVVATGGGVILRAENRQKLRSGKVVWLDANAPTLWTRMQSDTASASRRPNLAQGGLTEIEEMLKLRNPLYASCADLHVDTQERSPSQIADVILNWLAGAKTLDGD